MEESAQFANGHVPRGSEFSDHALEPFGCALWIVSANAMEHTAARSRSQCQGIRAAYAICNVRSRWPTGTGQPALGPPGLGQPLLPARPVGALCPRLWPYSHQLHAAYAREPGLLVPLACRVRASAGTPAPFMELTIAQKKFTALLDAGVSSVTRCCHLR